jgi:hypothetical protein
MNLKGDEVANTGLRTALWTAMGSMMVGWDNVSGGQLASLPVFAKKFGKLQSDGSYIVPAHILSAWQAIGPACDIIAALISAPFLEKYGRKPQIAVASILSVGGILLQQLASEWRTHLAGRAVNGEWPRQWNWGILRV